MEAKLLAATQLVPGAGSGPIPVKSANHVDGDESTRRTQNGDSHSVESTDEGRFKSSQPSSFFPFSPASRLLCVSALGSSKLVYSWIPVVEAAVASRAPVLLENSSSGAASHAVERTKCDSSLGGSSTGSSVVPLATSPHHSLQSHHHLHPQSGCSSGSATASPSSAALAARVNLIGGSGTTAPLATGINTALKNLFILSRLTYYDPLRFTIKLIAQSELPPIDSTYRSTTFRQVNSTNKPSSVSSPFRNVVSASATQPQQATPLDEVDKERVLYVPENSQDPFYPIIHQQFQQLTLADKERFERLFREIDVDGNGVIDFNDLVCALEKKGIKATHDNVKHIIHRSDVNLDGDIDFSEFVSYCLENEKQLHIIFKDIDLNDDGKIDEEELVHAFHRAGVAVDTQEVLRLVTRIKNDRTLGAKGCVELNYDEFRDYLLLHPTDSMADLMKAWRHGTFVDFGEDGLMPVDFSEDEVKTGMWWRHLIAGAVAGAVSRTSTAPLDRLKVFLQVRGAEFNGLGVCLRHMVQEGGVASLWRGNGINVLKIAPETAIKFMAFDQMKRWIHSSKSSGEITIVERFLAGSLAGAVSQTVIYPMEVLKTRFCLRSTGQYSGLLDAARKINAQGGLKNFYRGYVPNLLGIIPYAGIDLTIYETLKKMYLKHNSLEEAPIFVCLSCGTISSTFGQIASYPLALVRTRMQSELGNQRSSMVNMFRTIYTREGPRGLYRGITANIMKVAPAVSISYVVYEYTRRPLGAVMT